MGQPSFYYATVVLSFQIEISNSDRTKSNFLATSLYEKVISPQKHELQGLLTGLGYEYHSHSVSNIISLSSFHYICKPMTNKTYYMIITLKYFFSAKCSDVSAEGCKWQTNLPLSVAITLKACTKFRNQE